MIHSGWARARFPDSTEAIVLTDLALALSRRTVAGADPLRFLGEVAGEVARALQLAGAVVVVPATGWVGGSDDTARLAGEIQQRDVNGPVATAVRTARPVVTPDLIRIGPPALAALAGEVGLTSSAAVAVFCDGRIVAAVQLMGVPGRAVEARHVDALGPVLEVLGARIADMVEVDRMRRAPLPTPRMQAPVAVAGRDTVRRPEHAALPLGEAPPETVTEEMRAVGASVLPLQRTASRHRREG